MGRADIQTTMRYLHYVPRDEDAALVAETFRVGRRTGRHATRGSPRTEARPVSARDRDGRRPTHLPSMLDPIEAARQPSMCDQLVADRPSVADAIVRSDSICQ
jgi:hypothetical protein